MSENIHQRSAYARLLDRAIRILAMRDHSEKELRRKLVQPVAGKNGWEAPEAAPEDIERVVQWCHESRYLDDARFTRQFIASRCRKGYGPARIRLELGQKGISRADVDAAMAGCDIDWGQCARELARRKFGELLPTTFAERSKVQRFLLNRGHLTEDIQNIWKNIDV